MRSVLKTFFFFLLILSASYSFSKPTTKINGTIFTTKSVLNSLQKNQRIQLLISTDETIQLTQIMSNPPTEAILPPSPRPIILFNGKLTDLPIIWVKRGTRKVPVSLIPNSNLALSTRINRQFLVGAELHDRFYLSILDKDKNEVLEEQEFEFSGILYKLEEQQRFGE